MEGNKPNFGSVVNNNQGFNPIKTTVQPVQSVAPVVKSNEPTQAQLQKWADPAVIVPIGFDIAKKIKLIGQEIKDVIVERESLIDDCLVAIATGNHIVMIGDPGIAKSMLAREICKRITNGNYFEWLLNKTSDPSEILGPFSLKQLEKDIFIRKTEGMLPESHIAFLDEIFKSNEPTLNALLAITNERIFHNGGKKQSIPLISLIGASNEEPEDEGLSALYDRILFRFIVKPVGDVSNRIKMYNNYVHRRNPQNVNPPMTTVTVDELVDIRIASRYVTIPRDIINQYDALLIDLNVRDKIKVTDRRKNEGLGILQGSAMLNGRDVVTTEDFKHLIAVWWQRPEDVKPITDLIVKLSNPFDAKIAEHNTSIENILKRITEAPDSQKTSVVVECKTLLNTIDRDTKNLIKKARDQGKDISKLEDIVNKVNNVQKDIMNKYLGVSSDLMGGTGFDFGDNVNPF